MSAASQYYTRLGKDGKTAETIYEGRLKDSPHFADTPLPQGLNNTYEMKYNRLRRRDFYNEIVEVVPMEMSEIVRMMSIISHNVALHRPYTTIDRVKVDEQKQKQQNESRPQSSTLNTSQSLFSMIKKQNELVENQKKEAQSVMMQTLEMSDNKQIKKFDTKIKMIQKLLTSMANRQAEFISTAKTQTIRRTDQQMRKLERLFMTEEELLRDNAALTIQSEMRAIQDRKLYQKAADAIKRWRIRELNDFSAVMQGWIRQRTTYFAEVRRFHRKQGSRQLHESFLGWRDVIIRRKATNERNMKIRQEIAKKHAFILQKMCYQRWKKLTFSEFSMRKLDEKKTKRLAEIRSSMMEEALANGNVNDVTDQRVKKEYLKEKTVECIEIYNKRQVKATFGAWLKYIDMKHEKQELLQRAFQRFSEWAKMVYFHRLLNITREKKQKNLRRFGNRQNIRRAIYKKNRQIMIRFFKAWLKYAKPRQQAKKLGIQKVNDMLRNVWNALWIQVQKQHRIREVAVEAWIEATNAVPVFYFRRWRRYVDLRWAERRTITTIISFIERRGRKLRLQQSFTQWKSFTKDIHEYREKKQLEYDVFKRALLVEIKPQQNQKNQINNAVESSKDKYNRLKNGDQIDAHELIIGEMSNSLKIAQNSIIKREQEIAKRDELIAELRMKLVAMQQEQRKKNAMLNIIVQSAQEKEEKHQIQLEELVKKKMDQLYYQEQKINVEK
ncbi:MAG: hypothetical protein EZS28_027903, partial [Streblomastix strix]